MKWVLPQKIGSAILIWNGKRELKTLFLLFWKKSIYSEKLLVYPSRVKNEKKLETFFDILH